MNYFQLFRKTISVIAQHKSIWVLCLIYLSTNMLSFVREIIPEDAILLNCAFVIPTLLSLYLLFVISGGLVYITYQAILGQETTFKEAWSVGKFYFKQTFLALLLAIPLLIVWFYFWNLSVKNPNSSILFFVSQLVLYFVGSVIAFGECNIIIKNMKPWKAVWTGFLIVLNNPGRLLIINGFLLSIYCISLIFLFLLIQISSNQFLLPDEMGFNYQTLTALLNVPFINFTSNFVYLVTYPLMSVMYTLAYEKFIKEVEYPAIVQDGHAA